MFGSQTCPELLRPVARRRQERVERQSQLEFALQVRARPALQTFHSREWLERQGSWEAAAEAGLAGQSQT